MAARGLTPMWWLTFRHGDVVIVEASSLLHARAVAAQLGLGRPSHFAEGHFIDPDRAALIPHDFIGRMLAPLDARQVRDLLHSRSRMEPGPEPGSNQPRRRS
jgi:hypothetical protein